MKNFFITEKCVGCSACASDCPAQAIDNKKIPHEINQELCIKCGDCFEICPVGAIEFILKGDFYFDTDSGIG